MLAKSTQGESTFVIFFLHWLSGSGSTWKEVTEQISNRFRRVTIDLPGFGDSARVPGFTVDEMAAAVVEVIEAEQPPSWMLVGHSMGAKVATVVARRAEDGELGLAGLKSVALFAGSPPGPEPMSENRRAEMLTWFEGTEAESRSQALKFIDSNRERELGHGVTDRAVEDVLRMNRDAWLAWLQRGSREDCSGRVGVLRTPALIVAGELDPDLGGAGQRALMLPHFAFAEIKIVPDAKHLLPMEVPDLVAAYVAEASELTTNPVHVGPVMPEKYLQLIDSDRVSPQTRNVLLERAGTDSSAYEPQVLRIEELATLRAVADRVVPQTGEKTYGYRKIDLAARIDQQLAEAKGNGWRYDLLPPDTEAYRDGLRTLDAEAMSDHKMLFCSLTGDHQDELLRKAADGKLGTSLVTRLASFAGFETKPYEDHPLNGQQMQRWFEEVRGDIVRAYVAHPQTLARMGYSGIADGARPESTSGFVQIGLDQKEPWEPEEIRGEIQ